MYIGIHHASGFLYPIHFGLIQSPQDGVAATVNRCADPSSWGLHGLYGLYHGIGFVNAVSKKTYTPEV